MKYAEVSAEGIVTAVFDNTGEAYKPAPRAFLIQSEAFPVGSRYSPAAGSYPPAFAELVGTTPTPEAPAVDAVPEAPAPEDVIPPKSRSTKG